MASPTASVQTGLNENGSVNVINQKQMLRYISLKLVSMGHEVVPGADFADKGAEELLSVSGDLLLNHRQQRRLLSDYQCPPDRRIQNFLDKSFAPLKLDFTPQIPETFVLDHFGMAGALSMPLHVNQTNNGFIKSTRLPNGVLHNPKNDRRTTKGSFHVAEGGLPIPGDKIAVPLHTFAYILSKAFEAPEDLTRIPLSTSFEKPINTWCSLLLRPLVAPGINKDFTTKRLETRFFAPAGLSACLEFVERVFGNSGDPFLPENDSALCDDWTGHTGCVIVAPHIPLTVTKKACGLPHKSKATPAQIATGMCWESENELYNSGKPFKLTHRTTDGVVVTIIGDPYFGYCKKEVKTQISFSSNLFGSTEEEHAGGAVAFPNYNLGSLFDGTEIAKGERGRFRSLTRRDQTFDELKSVHGDLFNIMPEGHGVDRIHPNIIYLPENFKVDLYKQSISWTIAGKEQSIKLLPKYTLVHPTGYRVTMRKAASGNHWRLVGTAPMGTFCHKPCTVSGGGKSEISKNIGDAIRSGPLYVEDLANDLKVVRQLIGKDYSNRFNPSSKQESKNRGILSSDRSLGSVIKLLTESPSNFTPEYNAWISTIPYHVKALTFFIKKIWRVGAGVSEYRAVEDVFKLLSVDTVNGVAGHELKYRGKVVTGDYLRIGLHGNKEWRMFKLRTDFVAADKVQMEDDITASIVAPTEKIPAAQSNQPCLKVSLNCETRLFQRPDDAKIPGYDHQAEEDLAGPDTWICNFEPVQPEEARSIVEDFNVFENLTEPQRRILETETDKPRVVACKMRVLEDGSRSTNPRYLQVRPDFTDGESTRLMHVAYRLQRKNTKPAIPVDSVLCGRRLNPPQPSIKPLCVYNPLHFQNLPELFMDFVCSVTGKSPSTTGAGSEGALTKGPFNALRPTADLNATLVSYILTGYQAYSSAAGFVGPDLEVQHDISLLVPEIWCRLLPHERDAETLIKDGLLEKVEDFEHKGKTVLASRLGYRITRKFVHTYFGRIFDCPSVVFTPEILQPELSSIDTFADGVENLTTAQKNSADTYFKDESINDAIPPLKAVLHVMAHGHYNGLKPGDKEFDRMFQRDEMLKSDWYQARLAAKQLSDARLVNTEIKALEDLISKKSHADVAASMNAVPRLAEARKRLAHICSKAYVTETLRETIGTDPTLVAPGITLESMAPKQKRAGTTPSRAAKSRRVFM